MFLRNILNNTKRLAPNVRAMASECGPRVDLTVDNDGISILTMQRPPVNSLNLEMLQEISASLDEVAKNKSRGLILTSSSSTVFSAGIDILEMHKPDFKRAEDTWIALQDVWLKLFGSKFITAAATNGHAHAGGCMLSISCEYRAMVAGKSRIGLNETALGMIAPKWFIDTMCSAIPVRDAEYALTSAKMFTVDEALKIGLINEIATDKADAINKCKAFIKKFDKIPPLARSLTKQYIRRAPLKRLLDNRRADVEEFLIFIKNPKVQKSIEMYIEALKKKATN